MKSMFKTQYGFTYEIKDYGRFLLVIKYRKGKPIDRWRIKDKQAFYRNILLIPKSQILKRIELRDGKREA